MAASQAGQDLKAGQDRLVIGVMELSKQVLSKMVEVGQGRCSIKLEVVELLPMSRWRLGRRMVKEKRLNHLTCLRQGHVQLEVQQ